MTAGAVSAGARWGWEREKSGEGRETYANRGNERRNKREGPSRLAQLEEIFDPVDDAEPPTRPPLSDIARPEPGEAGAEGAWGNGGEGLCGGRVVSEVPCENAGTADPDLAAGAGQSQGGVVRREAGRRRDCDAGRARCGARCAIVRGQGDVEGSVA